MNGMRLAEFHPSALGCIQRALPCVLLCLVRVSRFCAKCFSAHCEIHACGVSRIASAQLERLSSHAEKAAGAPLYLLFDPFRFRNGLFIAISDPRCISCSVLHSGKSGIGTWQQGATTLVREGDVSEGGLMASTRTGVFVDDYLEYSSSLPAELQRLLSTMRELDERSQNMVAQLREQVKVCLMKKREGPEVDETVDKLRQVIESNQTNALRLCTEKVLLAQQVFDLIDSHVKQLDEDLTSFAEDLKQEGKIPQDEPAILVSATRDDKRRANFFTPLAKRIDSRLDRERSLEKERERDHDSELMPPPGSHRKKSLPPPTDIDQPIDPDEPTYCICGQVSFGDMIACDNEECKGGEWFHYQCVGLSSETRFKGKWYCLTCRALQRRGLLEPPL